MNRRHFLHSVSATFSTAALGPWGAGCTSGGELHPTGPTLGGIPSDPWWNRGNYAPVSEEVESLNLTVEGSIPPELNGVFLRNGANPASGSSPHWFLGDGMVHAVRIGDGEAHWYRNRWIQTHALGDSNNDNPAANRANTNLIHYADRVLALYEIGIPYELDPLTLATQGEYDFERALEGPMSAHPKQDPTNLHLGFIGYSPVRPYLRFHEADSDGLLLNSAIIDIPRPTMMHDFQLTPNYAVILDLPVAFDLSTADSGFPFVWSPDAGARIGLVSRAAPSETPQWFDIDLGFMFHTFNAHEDPQGRVVLEGCRVPSLWADSVADATQTPTPWRWTLDPRSGSSREGAFESIGVDFPMIDARRQGQANKLNYGLLLRGGDKNYPTHPTGLIKHTRASATTEV